MEVSFADVVTDLLTTEQNRRRIVQWSNRANGKSADVGSRQREFEASVRAFVHKRLFTVTQDEVTTALSKTDHPLGELRKEEASLPEVEDFDTPYSLMFLFHHQLESTGTIPLWQTFWRSLHVPPYDAWYLRPMSKLLVESGRFTAERIENAARWRLGKAYYSALRETYINVTLRERFEIPVKYHLAADLVLRIDGWYNNRLLYLRVPNNWETRKLKPVKTGRFEVVVIDGEEKDKTLRFGRGWVPSNTRMELIAELFRVPAIQLPKG